MRDIYLSGLTGGKTPFGPCKHQGIYRGDKGKAKKEGIRVTCEVTPHHIALYDNDYRVNPPIREGKM